MYQWLQIFFGLSYLPSYKANDGLYLMANALSNVQHFTDYIVDTLIDEKSLYNKVEYIIIKVQRY